MSTSDRPRDAAVFISYSRKDSAFVDRIEAVLQRRGFAVAIDREEIFAFEEWWKRIEVLITQADTVLFVVSPGSVTSSVALKEIAFAASLNKRFAPVVFQRVQEVPEAVEKYNFIFFDDESQFESSADKLAEALRTDIAWIRLHTEYGEAACRWSAANRPNGLLLRSPSLERAEHWLATRPEGAPAPTEDTTAFVLQSRAEAAQELRQLDLANRTSAQSIVNNLGIRIGEDLYIYLTPRQICEFWNLAAAEAPVKSNFVSILAEDPAETVRVAPVFAKVFRALGLLRPDASEAERLVAAVLRALQTTNANNSTSLVYELKALAPKLTSAQASGVLDSLVQQFDQAGDADVVRAQAQALEALASRLNDAQAAQVLDPLLDQIDRARDAFALQASGRALHALVSKLNNVQTRKALDPLLRQIGQKNDFRGGEALAEALEALSSKLTETQASRAFDLLLQQIGNETNSDTLKALVAALGSLAPKLSDDQAGKALDMLVDRCAQRGGLVPLATFAEVLEVLAAQLSEQQSNQACARLLRRLGQTKHSDALQALTEGLKALAVKLTDIQMTQAFNPLLKQLGEANSQSAARALGEGLKVLAAKLTETQVSWAVGLLLKRIRQMQFAWALRAVAEVLGGLPTKLSEAQTAQALDALLRQIGQTDNPHALQALAEGLSALHPKLTDTQARQALKPLLKQIVRWNNSSASGPLVALLDGIKALPVKLTQAQANQVLDVLLRQIDQDTNAAGLRGLMDVLPEKLTEAQANQILDALLRQIGVETNPGVNLWLAESLQVLTPKLTEAQALRASKVASSSLAWSAQEDQATAWARTLVTSTRTAADQERILVTAIAYPATAGPATEVLLDAIREQHPDAPSKEAGTEAALNWVASNYPWVLRFPECPEPPQPFDISGLRCPATTAG